MFKYKPAIATVFLFLIFTTQPAKAQLAVAVVGATTDFIELFRDVKATVMESYYLARDQTQWAEELYMDGKYVEEMIEQVQHRYAQIQHQITMVKGLDPTSLNSFFTSLHALDDQMNTINHQMDGMLNSSQNIVDTFEDNYPKMEQIASLDPSKVKDIVNNAYQAQRDNIKNGKARVAAIYEQSRALKTIIDGHSSTNNNVEGVKQAQQLTNQILLQQMQLNQSTHETLGQILKQAGDNQNNAMMLSSAMQVEASKTFKYTPQPITITGPGIYEVK